MPETPGQFTKDYHLVDFIRSDTAKANNFLEQYHPSDEIVDNLEHLAKTVVQPLKDFLGKGSLIITSGFRCKRLNEYIGASATSQHMIGQAVDLQFTLDGKLSNDLIIDTVLVNKIPFDQMIKEKSAKTEWIHISCKKEGNRFQRLNLNV